MVSQPAWDLSAKAEALLDADSLVEESTGPTNPLNEDEHWHVLMGPGEVKVLSLEQLDDFFRLEVIDESTFVWQDGMKDWAPLSQVAGLDADAPEEEKPTEPLGFPPVAFPQRASAAHQVVAPEPAHLPPAAAPSVPPASTTRPVGSSAPSSSTFPVSSTSSVSSPVQPSWAPSAVPLAQASPSVPAAAARPDSLQPLTVAQPTMAPRARERAARWPWVGAAVLGTLVTLYRNDVLHDVAHASGQAALYDGFEAVFGPPGFGTPRSVSASTPGAGDPAVASEAQVVGAGAEPTPSDASPPTAPSTAGQAAPSEEGPAEARAEAAPNEPEAPAAPSPTQSATSPSPRAAGASTPPRKAVRPPATSTPKKTTKGRNSEYDPMNAAL
jgi:hypothetical protein